MSSSNCNGKYAFQPIDFVNAYIYTNLTSVDFGVRRIGIIQGVPKVGIHFTGFFCTITVYLLLAHHVYANL